MGLTQKLGTIPLAIQTDSSNNVGIGGAANASYKLDVTGNTLGTGTAFDFFTSSGIGSSGVTGLLRVVTAGTSSAIAIGQANSSRYTSIQANEYITYNDDMSFRTFGSFPLTLGTNNTTRLTISASGNVGIGTSSPIGPLTIAVPATGSAIGATNAQQAYDYSRLRIKHYTDSNLGLSIGYAGANYTYIQACYNEGSTAPLFLNPFGNKITINTTDPGPNAQLISSGDQNDPYPIGAKAESASQGLIGFFNNANGVEGSISIASGVVSYNSFMGSHWSQLQDNSKPEILKGTILEAIDEFCTWEDETNDRLAKIKISDTIESKNVYGVFIDWDNTDNFNDMYVAALGAGYIRVNQNEVVSMGDLLQSNGDGTAKVQSDDIMRSSTIAKVVSTQKIETYTDGSYLIAATLHCG